MRRVLLCCYGDLAVGVVVDEDNNVKYKNNKHKRTYFPVSPHISLHGEDGDGGQGAGCVVMTLSQSAQPCTYVRIEVPSTERHETIPQSAVLCTGG